MSPEKPLEEEVRIEIINEDPDSYTKESCPECARLHQTNHLRFFYLSLEEAVYKCESVSCMYPFRGYKYRNLKNNTIYRYVEIHSLQKIVDTNEYHEDDSCQLEDAEMRDSFKIENATGNEYEFFELSEQPKQIASHETSLDINSLLYDMQTNDCTDHTDNSTLDEILLELNCIQSECPPNLKSTDELEYPSTKLEKEHVDNAAYQDIIEDIFTSFALTSDRKPETLVVSLEKTSKLSKLFANIKSIEQNADKLKTRSLEKKHKKALKLKKIKSIVTKSENCETINQMLCDITTKINPINLINRFSHVRDAIAGTKEVLQKPAVFRKSITVKKIKQEVTSSPLNNKIQISVSKNEKKTDYLQHDTVNKVADKSVQKSEVAMSDLDKGSVQKSTELANEFKINVRSIDESVVKDVIEGSEIQKEAPVINLLTVHCKDSEKLIAKKIMEVHKVQDYPKSRQKKVNNKKLGNQTDVCIKKTNKTLDSKVVARKAATVNDSMVEHSYRTRSRVCTSLRSRV